MHFSTTFAMVAAKFTLRNRLMNLESYSTDTLDNVLPGPVRQ